MEAFGNLLAGFDVLGRLSEDELFYVDNEQIKRQSIQGQTSTFLVYWSRKTNSVNRHESLLHVREMLNMHKEMVGWFVMMIPLKENRDKERMMRNLSISIPTLIAAADGLEHYVASINRYSNTSILSAIGLGTMVHRDDKHEADCRQLIANMVDHAECIRKELVRFGCEVQSPARRVLTSAVDANEVKQVNIKPPATTPMSSSNTILPSPANNIEKVPNSPAVIRKPKGDG